MDALAYLHLQLRLEGKSLVNTDRLRQVEFVPDEELPLMLIAQLADQNTVVYFDETLQSELCIDLTRQVSDITLPNFDSLSTLLQRRNISFEVGRYKSYTFPETYAAFKDETVNYYSKHDSKVQAFGFDSFAEEVYAIEKDGKIISACVSTRENKFCGEAWVYTNPQYRQQGFAQKVVGVWARNLLSVGKVPFYSHKIQNIASANLAKRLKLQFVFEEIVISYTNV